MNAKHVPENDFCTEIGVVLRVFVEKGLSGGISAEIPAGNPLTREEGGQKQGSLAWKRPGDSNSTTIRRNGLQGA